ncbi:hypothetical protein [Xenophilus sp.]|uniref:hypothetical protein n=1 Tax=Xenophilus sp. TaxID=1873499 RepID=UPI0037DDD844
MTMPCHPPRRAPALRRAARPLAIGGLLAAALCLPGCAVGVGFGVPLVPGLALGVGIGPGGPSLSLNTGWGPVGAGVGIDGGGRVVGSAGVGVSAGPVGVGVGQSVVLHDPHQPPVALVPPPGGPVVEPGVVVPGPQPPRPFEAP